MPCFAVRRPLTMISLAAAAALACAGCGEGAPAGATDAGGATTQTQTGTPAAPVLSDVMAMNGSLHVSWTATGCTTIEGERKTDMEAYAVVFTVDGAETSHVDDKATEDMTYTYRLRCEQGGTYSEYSNEKSGNPKKM